MKIAYFDCFSGVSGDMILGALVDAGLKLDALRKNLSGLAIQSYTLKARTIHKGEVRATKVDVISNYRPAAIKTLADLKRVIRQSRFEASVRKKGLQVLTRLVEAEARAHGLPRHRIRLHGMDPVDTLVDIMGAVTGLEMLGINRVVCSPIHVGMGMTGLAPATAEILKGTPIYSSGIPGELATPTGASLMTTLASEFAPTPLLKLDALGYGAGSMDLAQTPNLLRVLIGSPPGENLQGYETDRIIELQTNIDDLSPQIYEHLMERLFTAGALDVSFTPLIMKRGRPAIQVNVLGHHAQVQEILHVIFQETTTLGVRFQELLRAKLPRTERMIATRFGPVRVKMVRRGSGKMDSVPEYQHCKAIAQQTGLPLRSVLEEVRRAAKHPRRPPANRR